MNGVWKAGRLFVYQADVTNGAGGAGNQSYTFTPGDGNELEILYGELLNGDTSTRVATLEIDDGTNHLAYLGNESVTAGSRMAFPTADPPGNDSTVSAGAPLLLSGTMRLIVLLASVAASQNSALGLVIRLRGGVPTITEAGASTPTINVNVERVY